jgi:hypothetical protein
VLVDDHQYRLHVLVERREILPRLYHHPPYLVLLGRCPITNPVNERIVNINGVESVAYVVSYLRVRLPL